MVSGMGASSSRVAVARHTRNPEEDRPLGPLPVAGGEDEERIGFALAVAAGLDAQPRWLDSRYLYDAAGSAIFDRITEQAEYYQTRTEDALLVEHARAIREVVGQRTLVELGSGSASKTRRLLDAWTAAGPSRYVPVDVSARPLEQSCAALRGLYPGLQVEGIVSSYDRAFPLLHRFSPMVLTFLGSSLGNLGKHQQDEFLGLIAQHLAAGDFFLVGLDFVKSPAALEAAYDDAAGVTASFTRNLFARMNRELGAHVPLGAVRHVAIYNQALERVEIYAELQREVTIELPDLERSFRVARGERIRTELAHKYRPDAAVTAIERHGFRLAWRQADPTNGFGLFLFRRLPVPSPTSAQSRHTRRARWDALLDGVRRRTLEIVGPLSEHDLTRQHSRLMSPIVWDLGHVASFEALWLLERLESRGGDASEALDAVYDPLRTPRAERDRLKLPSPARTRAYLDDVRRRVHRQLDRIERQEIGGELVREGLVVNLVAQHEAQHQETILQAIALRDDLPYTPPFATDAPMLPPVPAPPEGSVRVPAGPFLMGTDDRAWAYDNERPQHQVTLPAYRIDLAPVTNGQYLAFMADDGYRRCELWTAEGWRWLQETRASAPGHWRRAPDGEWRAIDFGTLASLDPCAPVVHVCWYEADAYARWAGKRLPTEAEWEKAAAWDPARQVSRRYPWGDERPALEHANLDQRRLAPAAVGSFPAGRSPYGCLQMLGDVWEWTGSWFEPYPGFTSFPYREYSEIFFGRQYRVLRGGSFATEAIVARNTFRNWDFPERRQIFAGFRCAQDA